MKLHEVSGKVYNYFRAGSLHPLTRESPIKKIRQPIQKMFIIAFKNLIEREGSEYPLSLIYVPLEVSR